MANESNLIPFTELTKEEQRKIASKGGKASGKVRKEKKEMREQLAMLMNMPLCNKKIKEKIKENTGVDEEDIDNQLAINYALYSEALKGNVKAYETIQTALDTKKATDEEKEREQFVKISVYIPAKDMAKCFVDINRDIDDGNHTEYWLKGGRGSTKSSFVSEKIIELLENNPNMCAIALRKVGNTIKDSVYSQLEWAIGQIAETYPDVAKDYKATKSPLEITKLSTGQKIYFRGADEPTKIKSIKPPKGMFIGIIWYEEFDQFDGMNSVRKMDQSLMRGGEKFYVFRTYNTPPSTRHFVNIESRMPKANRLVDLSDYRSVPKKWLGQPFIDEAEYLKSVNPEAYDNEYLGLETGDGANVFNNIELRAITDEEIEDMDRIYRGLDFGWFPDPLAFSKVYFNANQRVLYILDEYVVNKQSNRDVWDTLLEKELTTEEDLITADSAEPKSIADFRSYGSNMRGAEKGPDSVPYSMKWLASLKAIVIDPERTPVACDEFCNYEYEKDKDGNIITGYPDADNHMIDSVRYALNTIWKRRGK